MKAKLILFYLLPFILAGQVYASDHDKFSKFVCRIISVSQNVKECHYIEQQKYILYQTIDKKEKKVQCLWYPQKEDQSIVISDDIWSSLSEVDYIMIGYGLSPSNPQAYYLIPKQKLGKKVNLYKLEKYRLTFPIISNKF